MEIEEWYEEEYAKVILQARTDEINLNKKVRIYHQQLHWKKDQEVLHT